MNEHKESTIEVSLNLNEVIIDYVSIALEKHACEHPHCIAKITCDLPKLCRDLANIIMHYLNKHLCYGVKTKTAEICCISPKTQYNYEHFVEP